MSVKVFANEFIESNWNNYLNYSQGIYNSLPDELKNSLASIDIPNDIKIVLISRLRSYANNWLFANLPALEDKKPIDLLKSIEGTKAVKETLLRMPD